jgi:hypothetical protein
VLLNFAGVVSKVSKPRITVERHRGTTMWLPPEPFPARMVCAAEWTWLLVGCGAGVRRDLAGLAHARSDVPRCHASWRRGVLTRSRRFVRPFATSCNAGRDQSADRSMANCWLRSGSRGSNRCESVLLGGRWPNRRRTVRGWNLQRVSVTRNTGRAFGPECFDLMKPEVDFASEETVAAVLLGSQLVGEPPL